MSDPHGLMEGWGCSDPVTEGGRKNSLRFWSHPLHGTFVCGLFDMYQTHGFPLSCSMEEARKRGAKLCPLQEKADALAAGWSAEKFEKWWQEGVEDASPVFAEAVS